MKGNGGMGNHKHGVSGHAGKSPRLRLKLKLDAERDERRPRPSATKFAGSMNELFRGDKP